MLALGVAVGIGLWLWLYRTRTGKVIRAGVDDPQMTSALGLNIQKTFAIAFAVGAALAALGAAVGSSQGNVASGQDAQWLLNALVVVIVGGMGSLLGAAAGRPALRPRAHVLRRLPAGHQQQLLLAVLDRAHVRADRDRARVPPAGPLRESRMKLRFDQPTVERALGLAVLVVLALGPTFFNDYWINTILTQMFIFGIAAASLIFLSAYGAMTSLAQTALMGICAYLIGNMVTRGGAGGETKGLTLGWDPTLALFLAIGITTVIGFIFGAVAARSVGIYFLMLTLTYGVIANYFFGQVTEFGGFSPIAGINQYTPGFVGDIVGHPDKLYYIGFGASLAVYGAIRYLIRTPFGLSLQGVRDDPVRMSSLGYYVPLHRTLAFTFAAFVASLAGVLLVWWDGQIAPGNIGLAATIELLVIAVIGGLARIEGAWVGAFAFIVINNYVRDVELPVIGGSFNTIIGLIFLVIVIVSPDGLMGLWDRLWRSRGKGGGGLPKPPP